LLREKRRTQNKIKAQMTFAEQYVQEHVAAPHTLLQRHLVHDPIAELRQSFAVLVHIEVGVRFVNVQLRFQLPQSAI
jgi:hypothetical protein